MTVKKYEFRRETELSSPFVGVLWSDIRYFLKPYISVKYGSSRGSISVSVTELEIVVTAEQK